MKTKTLIAASTAALTLTALIPATAGAAEPDTTPPDPMLRARERQDIHDVFKHGIQTTCGTEDRERPIDCRMTALRKGRVLAVGSGHIERPYNRYQFHLHLSSEDEARMRKAGTPVAVKLLLRVTDEAGNSATATKSIRLVSDLYG